MGTIDAFERDVLLQADSLPVFKPQRRIGDGRQRDVYIVSVSGRTISNIRVARLARRSFAITSNPKSRLAGACTGVIPLTFPNSDAVTAGSISFLDSALTCISLVCECKMPDARGIFRRASALAKKIRLQNRVFFLGNLHTYPVAMYAAAKLYELLGAQASYERLEQFSHMGLFSAKRGDTVVILEEKTAHAARLVRTMRRIGLHVIHPDPKSGDKMRQFLFFTFLSQLVPLNEARRRGMRDCHFVTAKKLRGASDDMIY